MSALILAILVSLAPAVVAPSASTASADSTGSLRPAAPMPVTPPAAGDTLHVPAAFVPAVPARQDSGRVQTAAGDILRGQATWYASATRGNAAAGPALRRFIGHGWRGSAVDVCRGGVTWIACVRVRLTDWCACSGERVIDLSDEDFSTLAPLSAGVIRVRVALGAPPRETITQPPTDTE